MFDFACTKAVHAILCNTIVGSLSQDENPIAYQNICLLILPQFAVDLSVMEQFFAAADTTMRNKRKKIEPMAWKHDPIEDDPIMQIILEIATDEADAEMIGTNLEYFYGEIRDNIKKRILKEKYQVDWKTFRELNHLD